MQLDPNTAKDVLASFLRKWPPEKVRKMTLKEYVSVSNRETFTYWVETGTRTLGNIKGRPSIKFEIYKRDDPAKEPPKFPGTSHDNQYTWHTKFGKDRKQAFRNIKKAVVSIIEASLKGEFHEVEKIHFDALVKWKIAFLYSKERLLPVYKAAAVKRIANALGIEVNNKSTMSDLYLEIIQDRPQGKDIYQYALELYSLYGKNNHNYFTIGSKYQQDDGSYLDVFPKMHQQGVISIGFGENIDLSKVYGSKKRTIDNAFSQQPRNSQIALKNFMMIRPGDYIAIKEFGKPNCLRIRAYAIVNLFEDGTFYKYDPNGLGHLISVEFIETDLELELPLTKPQTVHVIENTQEIDMIFKEYPATSLTTNRSSNRISKKFNTTPSKRSSPGETIIRFTHREFQNQLLDRFSELYGEDHIELELDHIDLMIKLPNKHILFEIKTSQSPINCIREALGQLLFYDFKHTTSKKVELIIVGPRDPSVKEKKFIEHIDNVVSLPLKYRSIGSLLSR